jgi:hypothetical protein
MWLIDSTTIRLKFVTSAGSSPYAILSHTWNDNDEVIFQEFNSPDRDIAHPRFLKIMETCRLARGKGIPYVWVDSCCIDKTSSAELTEAINSMFRRYRESAICFTCLADLAVGSEIEPDLPKCKWFTRGWTLQELVAPRNVEFYDESWNLIGDKISLLKPLIEKTRIQEDVLRDSNSLPNYTVAMRMSWAANRQTTREEDLAYCLLGIFDVYLPLTYGEGINAFIRLQEAIGQVTYDLSLFAWTDQDSIETRQDTMAFSLVRPQNSMIALRSGNLVLGSFLHMNTPSRTRAFDLQATFMMARMKRKISSSILSVGGRMRLGLCLSVWYRRLADTYDIVQIPSLVCRGSMLRSYREVHVRRSIYPRR